MPKEQPAAKLDDELDRLYGLPLEEFTAERNALARELRKAGDREEADRVKALPKPSISAWVVNQLARKERLQMRSLATSGERLRKAQEKLLRGGAPNELQEASDRQREVVAALGRSAEAVLRSAGHPATDATLERVRATLTAAAGDEEGLVQQGRLSEDLDPTGFGPLALGTSVGRPAAGQPKSVRAGVTSKAEGRRQEAEERKNAIEEAKRELDALRAEVNEQTAHARSAKAEAKKAAKAAEAATKAVEKEERRLEQLRERVATAKEALDRARSR
jgi:hypothetical protein